VIPRLFYFTDGERGTGGRELADVIQAAAGAGLGAVVLREFGLADAELTTLLERLQPLRRAGLRVLASRRLDLARSGALDGVHLAADAIPVDEARAWLGPDVWLGYSAHSGDEARAAAAAGASYVTLSPIYATGSKPGAEPRGAAWLARALADVPVPVLALGGVTPARSRAMLGAGAWGVAAVSAIGAAPDVAAAVADFHSALGRALGQALEQV